MSFKLNLVSTTERVQWINERYNLNEVIYMGDGIFDHYVMKRVSYSIATNDSDTNAKKYANFVTKRNGGNRAVAEACMHICLLYTSPSPRDRLLSRMPSSA